VQGQDHLPGIRQNTELSFEAIAGRHCRRSGA
jgi:hypothetical protein